MGFGYWAIQDKDSGRFLGELGFADYKREIAPALDGRPELGWVVASHSHGRGYATEAVRAAIEWGAKWLKSKEIACIIHPENAASIRVAQKCGFEEQARTTYKNQPTVLFSRRLV